ncbi:hypothetical protein [Marinobacter confluentis]|uniref:Uncharacterized protein n=1 Tax=Marinobacter confluentis TaxID=1697557 RepID=A0A4Z1C2X3_9GAMM|nr:hypothetical protein [Marinobacter confluentis]TGN39462.1 hypothetical protein E5Q11_12625 [Marinobacter confluentis]
MNRIEVVRQAVAQQLDDPYDLLAMRLMFPPDRAVVRIDKEISDLYAYPERLQASYRDEWLAIATRAVFRNAFSDHWRSDEENLDDYLRYLRSQAIPKCIHDHIELFRKLGEVLQIDRSDNTIAFPDPGRRALMKIIWPDR